LKSICIAQNVSLCDHFGLSSYLRNIALNLGKMEDIELVLMPLKGSSVPSDLSNYCEILELEGGLYCTKGNARYAMNLYRKLKELSTRQKLSLIHCIYPNSSVLGAVYFKLAMRKRTKILYDIRSPWVEMGIERGVVPGPISDVYKKLAYLSDYLLASYVDRFIFITQGLKQFYEKIFGKKLRRWRIVPSGVDLMHFSGPPGIEIREMYGIEDEDLLLGYVGGLSRNRGLSFVLRGLQILAKEDDRYRLIFVGSGDDEAALKKLSKKLSIDNKVVFAGKVPYEDVPKFINALDVGICHLPDTLVFRYSFPMKVLEYLACNIPVLASNVQAHREISRDVKGVFIYESLAEFVSQIHRLLDSSQHKLDRRDLRQYDWTNICRQIYEEYTDVCQL